MYDKLDLDNLTDDQLYDKIQKLNRMVSYYIGIGMTSMVESVELNMAMLQEEHEYRMKMKVENANREREKSTTSRFTRKNKKQKKENPNIIATLGHIKGVDD